MDMLWKWLEEQGRDIYPYFAFRISKLGVFSSFPDDLALLTEHQGYR